MGDEFGGAAEWGMSRTSVTLRSQPMRTYCPSGRVRGVSENDLATALAAAQMCHHTVVSCN